MIVEYIHPEGTREIIQLQLASQTTPKWLALESKSKMDFIKKFLPAYISGQKLVLFDANHKQLLDFYQENDINTFENIAKANANAQLLFFTSGSSGFPLGAFKSKENLQKEIEVLAALVHHHSIKRVLVSVPFVHIYGVLAGLLLPLHLRDVRLIVKDDFLPYELLNEAASEDTLVITTPVFIKALSKLSEAKNLSSALFICSTGPLCTEDIVTFETKYQTNLLQLFGSTETGGIAYKLGSSERWSKLPLVKISASEEKLNVTSPFVSEFVLEKEIRALHQPFQTEDIVAIEGDAFQLLGRSNKLIKIAGKRVSATQIESILESIAGVKKAVVSVVYKKELLRSEQILITLEADETIDTQKIKHKISERYGTLNIPFKVQYRDTIHLSAMGKKVLF